MSEPLQQTSPAEVPQLMPEERVSAWTTAENDQQAAPPGKLRVLLVDDDPATNRALARSLTSREMEVETCLRGSTALERLAERPFDVVLTDISMPEMDGFDLLRAIQAAQSDLPVVLLTGDPTVSSAARALEVGAFRYVTKPADPMDLRLVVQKAARMFRLSQVKQEALELFGPTSHQKQHDLEQSFDRCIDKLWIAFQPIVDARAEQTFGFEALMRSNESALPHPGAVLDAAEKLNRIQELGQVVRQRVGAALPGGPALAAFFVNLHVRDLLDETLLSSESPLSAFSDRVVLEITERASLTEVPDITERIATLRRLGYRIAVDDLGAGYAGLTSFALLEPEFVKLDMSLVRDIHQSPIKTKVVRSMINLAKEMGMLVVGEGIECVEERDALVDLGCDYLQGYLFAKPASPFPEVCW